MPPFVILSSSWMFFPDQASTLCQQVSITAPPSLSLYAVLVATVKRAILYAFVLLVPAIMATGMTGMKLGGKSSYPPIAAKRRRMPFIAANGVLILIPCAIFLSQRAGAGIFDGVFYAVQALELLAGAVNITLMALSIRDARNLKQKRHE